MNEHNPTHTSRPRLPKSYGIEPVSESSELLPWSFVESRMADARNYWLATVSQVNIPHAAPVWGVWQAGALYFATDPASRKARNLAANPEAVVHLESGDEVVILEGIAEQVADRHILEQVNAVYSQKYDIDVDLPNSLTFRLEPRRAFAWLESAYPGTATRWEFSE